MPKYDSGYIAVGLYSIGSENPSFNTKGFIASATNALANELHMEASVVKEYFESTVETWETDVYFTIKTDRVGDKFSLVIYTDSDIYRFVNDGTSIRYAVMTEDFIPKTYPGVIASTEGRGGFGYIPKDWKTRNIPGVYPKPGIKPREFVDAIYNQRKDLFYMNMNMIFDRVISEFWDQAFSG